MPPAPWQLIFFRWPDLPSIGGGQEVSDLRTLAFFSVLTCFSTDARQLVSAPRLLAGFRYLNLSLRPCLTVGERSSLAGFFRRLDLPICLRSAVGECT